MKRHISLYATRAKLHRHDDFGLLGEVPFLKVLGHVEEL